MLTFAIKKSYKSYVLQANRRILQRLGGSHICVVQNEKNSILICTLTGEIRLSYIRL